MDYDDDWLFVPTGTTPQKHQPSTSVPTHQTPSPAPAPGEITQYHNNYTPTEVDWLFEVSGSTPEAAKFVPSPLSQPPPQLRSKPGRKRKTVEYPQLVEVMSEYVTRQGFSAHRNRDQEGTSGVKLGGMQNYAFKSVGGLKCDGISKTTCGRMCVAPNKKFNASRMYTGKLLARIPKKRNDLRSVHEDDHIYKARVKMVLEFGSFFPNDCLILSCDNKNKINVGTLAVSRHLQINTRYPLNDAPNYPDHDFPIPNNKITPMGYMVLKPNDVPHEFKDKHNRRRILHPRSEGNVHIVNRAQGFHASTIAEHYRDLLQVGTHAS